MLKKLLVLVLLFFAMAIISLVIYIQTSPGEVTDNTCYHIVNKDFSIGIDETTASVTYKESFLSRDSAYFECRNI